MCDCENMLFWNSSQIDLVSHGICGIITIYYESHFIFEVVLASSFCNHWSPSDKGTLPILLCTSSDDFTPAMMKEQWCNSTSRWCVTWEGNH